MKCPHCCADDKEKLHRVVGTKDYGSAVLRYRKCWNCGRNFTAVEKYASECDREDFRVADRKRAKAKKQLAIDLKPIYAHLNAIYLAQSESDVGHAKLEKIVSLLESLINID